MKDKENSSDLSTGDSTTPSAAKPDAQQTPTGGSTVNLAVIQAANEQSSNTATQQPTVPTLPTNQNVTLKAVTLRSGGAFYLFVYANQDLTALWFKDVFQQDAPCTQRAQPQEGLPFICYVQVSERFLKLSSINGSFDFGGVRFGAEIPVEHR